MISFSTSEWRRSKVEGTPRGKSQALPEKWVELIMQLPHQGASSSLDHGGS